MSAPGLFRPAVPQNETVRDYAPGSPERFGIDALVEAVRGYAQGTQKGGDRTGKFLAPRSETGMQLRNRLLSNRVLLNLTTNAVRHSAARSAPRRSSSG